MQRVTESSSKLDPAPLDAFLKLAERQEFLVPSYTVSKVRLLKAILMDPPKALVEDGSFEKIEYWASQALSIISSFDFKIMNQEMAFKLVERLNFFLILMSHWMDLIRMVYGKEPKASRFYYFVYNLAPLDALVDSVEHLSPLLWDDGSVMCLLFLKAILMDPPQESIGDGTLKKLEFMAREVGSIISSIDLKNMNQHMAHVLCYRLLDIAYNQEKLYLTVDSVGDQVSQIYEKRPKPSRMYYPRTGQLGFVEHLVDNLGELLVKAKADASIGALKFHILRFQRELQQVSCQLTEIPEPRKEEADLKDNITNIANLAYEAEYVIDSFLVGDIIPTWYSMLCLRHFQTELKHERGLLKMRLGDANLIGENCGQNSATSKMEIACDLIQMKAVLTEVVKKILQGHPIIRQVGGDSMESQFEELAQKP